MRDRRTEALTTTHMFIDGRTERRKPYTFIDANVYRRSNLRDRRTETLTTTQMFMDGRTEGRKTGSLHRCKSLWTDGPRDAKSDAYIHANVYERTNLGTENRTPISTQMFMDEPRDGKPDAYMDANVMDGRTEDGKPDAYIDTNIYGRTNLGTENRTPTSTQIFMDGRT